MPTYEVPSNDVINVSNGMMGFLIYLNNATFGWLSRGILIALYIIVALTYFRSKDDFLGALALSGFATFVIAFLLWLAGFVNGIDLGVAFGVMIVGLLGILLDKQGTQ